MSATKERLIENFVRFGDSGKTTKLLSTGKVLWYTSWRANDLPTFYPIAVRLPDDMHSVLVDGSSHFWEFTQEREGILKTLSGSNRSYAVIPFDSIAAALTNGEKRSWGDMPYSSVVLRDKVQLCVPSQGEKWFDVTVENEQGEPQTRKVHTLGDSVVLIENKYYISMVDETGTGRGAYCFTELPIKTLPKDYKEALDSLKPKLVKMAEQKGLSVKRQGEWFAIPTLVTTEELMADVQRGDAIRRREVPLGRDGHHVPTDAVVYKNGPRKGEVYARGIVAHSRRDHYPLYLGKDWFRLVHSVQGQSYNLGGSFD